MPEYLEIHAQCLILKHVLDSIKKPDDAHKTMEVLNLYADRSVKEQKKYRKGSRVAQGLVDTIGPSCSYKRGQRFTQTDLYPPMFRDRRGKSPPPPISTLFLRGSESVKATNRAIILDLGPLHLSLAPLTHTSVQLYPRKVWEESILKTNKTTRRFHVALAFEFEHYVLAFLSRDLMFQPTWATNMEDLPHQYPDVHGDYHGFLTLIACWILTRAGSTSKRDGLAINAVQDSVEWHGVGAYTVIELFVMAGISPFSTEMEVFDNPSRTGRLCGSFYSFAHKARDYTKIWPLLSPCIHGTLIAPTRPQRLEYKPWLHAYAKAEFRCADRHAESIDDFEARLAQLGSNSDTWCRDEVCLYDTFEPDLLRAALEQPDLNLGHLIFGSSEWTRLRQSSSEAADPLTKMFSKRGLLQSQTFLHPDRYQELFTERKHSRVRTVYSYDTQVWSVTHNFPSNSLPTRDAQLSNASSKVTEMDAATRHRSLFQTIVMDSQDVAIGPLEYCGHGRPVRSNKGKIIVATCLVDPMLPKSLLERESHGYMRKKMKLEQLGSAKTAMTTAMREKMNQEVNQPSKTLQASTSSNATTPNVKKCRLSADKHIASGVEKENVGETDAVEEHGRKHRRYS